MRLQLAHNQLTSDDATAVLRLIADQRNCSLRHLDFSVRTDVIDG